MEVRALGSSDAEKCQALRLQALKECPTAFASSYEEECDTPMTIVAQSLAPDDDHIVFGAFEDQRLIGTICLQRENKRKLAHKAIVWGMYVDPGFRSRGTGRNLIDQLLRHATAMPNLRQLTLRVNAANRAACALYEAAGFRAFGVERGSLLVDGALQDEIHMAYVITRQAEESHL